MADTSTMTRDEIKAAMASLYAPGDWVVVARWRPLDNGEDLTHEQLIGPIRALSQRRIVAIEKVQYKRYYPSMIGWMQTAAIQSMRQQGIPRRHPVFPAETEARWPEWVIVLKQRDPEDGPFVREEIARTDEEIQQAIDALPSLGRDMWERNAMYKVLARKMPMEEVDMLTAGEEMPTVAVAMERAGEWLWGYRGGIQE